MAIESKFFKIDEVIPMDQRPGENILSVHLTDICTQASIHWVVKLSETVFEKNYRVLEKTDRDDIIQAYMDGESLVEIFQLLRPDKNVWNSIRQGQQE